MSASSFTPDSFATFGDLLKYLRRREQLTQLELSIAVGYSEAQISRLEKNQRLPDLTALKALFIPALHLESEPQMAKRLLELAHSARLEDAPWLPIEGSSRSNLPASTTSLIGRENDVAGLHGYLSIVDIRLVTVIGPPGIGKTRLSIEAARKAVSDFTDRVFFVPLAPLDDPVLLAPTIIQTLGFVEARNQSPLERLKEGINDKKMLLVLDNLEHLLESAVMLISDLLPVCPRLKILATSREALRLPGEWLYPVPPLDLPPVRYDQPIDAETAAQYAALKLFAERARAVRPDFSLNVDNIQAVAKICTWLDGLPLAIELLAARMKMMTPQMLLSRMKDEFPLHAGGMRAASPRQRNLHNAIAWSYHLLTEEEKRLFTYLSVMPGGFSLDTVEEIFSQTTIHQSVSDLVASLLNKSLLQLVIDEQGEPRFTMLVTIQQFALERLRERGEAQAVRDHHLAYFLDLAEKAEQEIHGPNQVEWINRLDREQDNYRAALEWSMAEQKTEATLRLLTALGWQWVLRWDYSELLGWFEKIRALPEVSAHPLVYARLLNYIGRTRWLSGDFKLARTVLEESREIGLRFGEHGKRGLAEALSYLGLVVRSVDRNFTRARSLLEQSFEIYQKCEDRHGMALTIFQLGWGEFQGDQAASALSLGEQSLDLFTQAGDQWGMGRSSQLLGQIFLKQGNYEKARQYIDQHLTIDKRLNFKPGIVAALINFGDFYRYQGDDTQAEMFYTESLAICREFDMKWDQSNIIFSLGLVALHRDDYPLTEKYLMDYFDIARNLYVEIGACDLFYSLAAVAAGMGQLERSAKLRGAAQAILDKKGYTFHPFDRLEFERHIQMARLQLGGSAFDALAADGYLLSIEQAVAYALEKDISPGAP